MYRPEHGIRLRSSARSDRGRVRQNNEDNVHLWDSDYHVLAVVADGMGGAVAGEEASRIAVETIQEKLSTETYRKPEDYHDYDPDDLAEFLGGVIREANMNILHKAINSPELKGMGTTVTLAFARETEVILAHVGDSRAYFVDGFDGTIQQLTADHSFVQALVHAGHITPEEAEEHPMRNVLYRALGQAEDLDVDLLQNVAIQAGDRIVLCSDGLTLHVRSDEIADTAMDYDDPHKISEKLVALANSRGGKDNVSVIVIVAEDDKTQGDQSLETLEFTENDDHTLPMDPNMVRITRVQDTLDSAEPPSEPINYHQLETYGEGRDNHFDSYG